MNDFVSTTEMDREIVAMLCEISNKDVSEAREALREVQILKETQDRSKAARRVEAMETDLPEGRNFPREEKDMRVTHDRFQTRLSVADRAMRTEECARCIGVRIWNIGTEAQVIWSKVRLH
ncbi:hypothetical protein GCK32_005476 [Trichostrongylus colubriformis]|uniref:Uncharacterized protein n=1 Tax=Trichostrongylus colubriformis TaxID=6319 RepID=A0AAN8ISA9_TRICO